MRTMFEGPLTTADQLLVLDEPGCRRELVRGELRRMSFSGWWNGAVAATVGKLLCAHMRQQHLGVVVAAGTGFLLARNPDTVRSPDAAFVRSERLPKHPTRDYFEGAPDLAVEVTSPTDTWEYVHEKAQCWLAHGASAVWVVEAEARRVTVFRARGTVTVLGANDALHGDDALAGFTIPVAELFPAFG